MALSVGSAASTYDLDLRPFRKSLKEAMKGIEDLRRAGESLGQGGGGGLPPPPSLPTPPKPNVSNTDRQVLALANARAREAVAAGEAARAEEILKNALEQVDKTSVQAINTSTRLLNIQNRLSNEKGPVVLPRTIAGFSGDAEKAAQGAVKLAQSFMALQAVQVVTDLSQTGAQASLVRSEFDKLAKQSGTTGDAMIGALREASKGEISDLNLELSANRANMLGVAKSSKEMATLLEIARDRAHKLGRDTGGAFDDLVTGLGRASAEILDNLAIQVNAEEVNRKYAASVGKTVEQLTQAEKRQAMVNAVIEQGKASLSGSADAADDAAGSWARFNASLDNTKASAGIFLNTSTPLIPLLNAMASEMDVISGKKPLSAFFNLDTLKLGASLNPIGQVAGVVEKGISSLDRALLGMIGIKVPENLSAWDAAGQNNARVFKMMENTANGAATGILRLVGLKVPEGFNIWAAAGLVAGGAFKALIPGAQQATQATQQLAISNAYYVPTAQQAAAATLAKAQAEVQAATSGQLYTNAQGQATLATQQSADASLLASVASAQYQTQMQLMEMQTKAAADQFLALNPNIDQSGVASALAAGKISTAVAQYIAMTLHTAEARAQLAALQAQAGVSPGPVGVGLGGSKPKAGPGRRGDVGAEFDAPLGSPRAVNQANANIALSKAQAEAEKARQQALEDQITTTGTAAQKQKLYNDRLTEAKRIYGENSAEAIRAETALKSFQQSQAKGGGGRAKVSDQEKLNNGLYQDAVKFGYKMQDEEQKHVDNLQQIDQKHLKANAKIWQDYYQKLSQAERQYRQASLDSRADFYSSLASIDNRALQQSASQRYEEIARNTAEIAQTRGADAAQAYQEAAVSGLNKELQIEQQIADLRNKSGKNKSQQKADEEKAKYLDGVLKAQREADANRVTDAQAAGSQLASERDKALADEQASYQEQVDQEAQRFGQAQKDIATDSERSAERQVTAAQLARKNIQDVRTEVQGLGDDYAKVLPGGTPTLGPVASQPGVTSATPAQEPQAAPTPTADTAAARGAAGQALNIMQVADVAVLGAINAQTAALGAKLDMLAERVRGVESAIRTSGGRDALS